MRSKIFYQASSIALLAFDLGGVAFQQTAFGGEAPAGVSMEAAIERTLADQPGVKITYARVAEKQGRSQTAAGQFDAVLISGATRQGQRLPSGVDGSSAAVQEALIAAQNGSMFRGVQEIETTGYATKLSKHLRSGITVGLSAELADKKDHGVGIVSSEDPPVSRSDLSATLTVPLLQGLGRKAVGAEERAARISLQAQEELRRHQISQLVYQTIAAFWDCLGAQRNLEILKDVEGRSTVVLQLVHRLTEAGELDKATLNQAKAVAATKQINRQNAELVLYKARQALGLAMGLGLQELGAAPVALGEFLPISNDVIFSRDTQDAYVATALEQRGDYRALKLSVQANQSLLEKARDNLKPKLDFSLKGGYAGVSYKDSSVRPLYSANQNLTGANILASLQLAWPLRNSAARGAFVTQSAQFDQAELERQSSVNSIASDLLNSMATVQKNSQQYMLVVAAMETYKRSVEQTKQKLNNGEATLTELIDIEDRYALSRQSVNQTLHDYYVSVILLHLLTGTLSVPQGEVAKIEVAKLFELPLRPTAPSRP